MFPGLAVFVTVMALNLIGEALRDALDPRLRATVGGAGDVTPERSQRFIDAPPSSGAFDEAPHV